MASDDLPIEEKALPMSEKIRLKSENARLRSLWFPIFTETEMEERYLATVVRKSVRAKLVRMWVVLNIVWIAGFLGKSVLMGNTGTIGVRASVFVGQLAQAACIQGLLALRFTPDRLFKCLELDSVVTTLTIIGALSFQFANLWRAGYMFAGDAGVFFRQSSGDCNLGASDTLMLLMVLMIGTAAITGLRIRTRCSFVVSVVLPCIYAAFSLPPGMSPHDTFDVIVHVSVVITSFVLSWTSQRVIDIERRVEWMRTLMLEDEVLALSFPAEESEKTKILKQLRLAIQEEDDLAIQEARRSLCSIGLSNKDVDAQVADIRKENSERFGVSAAYLLSDEFVRLAVERTGHADPTFYEMKDSLFCGPDALGKTKLCPRDGQPGCAIIDTLPPQHRGFCTHFLSWTWGYKLSSLRSALEEWLARSASNPEQVFFWMCFFVNNQYRILVAQTRKGSDNLGKTFEGNLRRIGKVVAVLDTWEDPVYLKRIWTLFEQFTAINLGIEVEMALPAASAHALVERIEEGREGILAVVRQLSKVDCQTAAAFDPHDEERVKSLIQTTVGFDAVENKIKGFMLCWVASAVEERFNQLVLGASSQQEARSLEKRKSVVSSMISQFIDFSHDEPDTMSHSATFRSGP